MRIPGIFSMMFIQNLRIGTKLAVTSALTLALVALMIFLQLSGAAEHSQAEQSAVVSRPPSEPPVAGALS